MTLLQLAFTTKLRRPGWMVAAGLLFIALSADAFATEDPQTSDLATDVQSTGDRPWAAGVSKERQDSAEVLFLEGNRLFLDSFFKAASQKYREALKQWDHPSIHYNLALSLNNMDDPIEAHRHLVEALKYDGAPLDAKRREEANRHFKATGRQISTLEVSCQELGAVVSLDGKEIMTGPNRSTTLLMPGRHLVSVKKPGYLPREYPLTLVPGAPERVEARVFTEEQLVESRRPMPFWLPVAVTATGVGMVLTGAILGTRSDTLLKRVDSQINGDEKRCASGCQLTSDQRETQHNGDLLKTWSTVSFVAGAVTTAGGAVLLLFNQSKTKQYTPEERERQTTVAPIVGSNVLGAMAAGRF